MCTLAFIPNGDHVLILSLRDESPSRPKAYPPKLFSVSGFNLIYPHDSEGGGTWIGANQTGAIVVLLNGAFEKHERILPYAGSRGMIVKRMLESEQAVDSWKEMDLNGFEAHTLVVFQQNQLHQLVWDEKQKHHKTKDPAKPFVLSSATLYDLNSGALRNQALLHRINSGLPLDRLSLLKFFQQHSDKENGFFINRNERVKTLSMSYLVHTGKKIEFNYHELNSDQLHFAEIEIINTGHD